MDWVILLKSDFGWVINSKDQSVFLRTFGILKRCSIMESISDILYKNCLLGNWLILWWSPKPQCTSLVVEVQNQLITTTPAFNPEKRWEKHSATKLSRGSNFREFFYYTLHQPLFNIGGWVKGQHDGKQRNRETFLPNSFLGLPLEAKLISDPTQHVSQWRYLNGKHPGWVNQHFETWYWVKLRRNEFSGNLLSSYIRAFGRSYLPGVTGNAKI